jgi:hypothetical protein
MHAGLLRTDLECASQPRRYQSARNQYYQTSAPPAPIVALVFDYSLLGRGRRSRKAQINFRLAFRPA